ncbi:InlB B-repeat-containing protein [Hornefia butyriciproducens]|uniref:InlB B-repeat-containing protein n=1 Tax=Hornefia butyriciproducens TaxID=2652293 RepID=UPI003D0133BE
MKKRLFSILLSLCMVLALMPQMVFAEEPGNYDELQGRLNDAIHGGTVKLEKDYTITSSLQVDNKTVTLDLNGHVIKKTSNGGVIKVINGANLTLQDSSPKAVHTGEYVSLPAGGVITIEKYMAGSGVYVDGSSFAMNGGTIYDCFADDGGAGVHVINKGSFVMNNGAISSCTTGGGGGGVLVSIESSFTMNGGTISDCYAGGGCGGIEIYEESSFTMNGGTISDSGSEDGAARAVESTIFANGGTIMDKVELYNSNIENTATYGGTVFYGGINIFNSSNIIGKTITFKKDDKPYAIEIVAEGKKAIEPIEPTKEGYEFAGWYTDEALNNLYNFDMPVNDELILYAGWEEEKITLTVPFTTTVELGGNASPGETTFNLQVLDSSGEKLSSGDVIIEITSVKTNGARSYEGEITFTGTEADIFNMFNEYGSVFVKQEDAAYPNWKIDDTVWCLFYRSVAELSEGEEEAPPILIVPASLVPSDDGTGFHYAMDTEAKPEQLMIFTNTYTKSEDSPAEPDGTTNGEADKDSKADTEDSAKTGDDTNLALWLALMLLAGAGITGTTIYTRRKRTNE